MSLVPKQIYFGAVFFVAAAYSALYRATAGFYYIPPLEAAATWGFTRNSYAITVLLCIFSVAALFAARFYRVVRIAFFYVLAVTLPDLLYGFLYSPNASIAYLLPPVALGLYFIFHRDTRRYFDRVR
jgi:hypothetical protein